MASRLRIKAESIAPDLDNLLARRGQRIESFINQLSIRTYENLLVVCKAMGCKAPSFDDARALFEPVVAQASETHVESAPIVVPYPPAEPVRNALVSTGKRGKRTGSQQTQDAPESAGSGEVGSTVESGSDVLAVSG